METISSIAKRHGIDPSGLGQYARKFIPDYKDQIVIVAFTQDGKEIFCKPIEDEEIIQAFELLAQNIKHNSDRRNGRCKTIVPPRVIQSEEELRW